MDKSRYFVVMKLSLDILMDAIDLEREGDYETFSAHWSLFAPSILIIGFYALLWWVLDDRINSHGLARLSLVVVLIGGPFLFVHALLRFHMNRVELGTHDCVIRRLFDAGDGIPIAYEVIRSVRFSRGLLPLPGEAGSLMITLFSGQSFVISDIERGAVVCDRLRHSLPHHQMQKSESR